MTLFPRPSSPALFSVALTILLCSAFTLSSVSQPQPGAASKRRIVGQTQPTYPPLARQTRISGTVRLHAIIAKDGSIQSLEVMSGHPLLQQSALDAVRQWKYQATLLNGEPVEVDTTIDVIFSLNQ